MTGVQTCALPISVLKYVPVGVAGAEIKYVQLVNDENEFGETLEVSATAGEGKFTIDAENKTLTFPADTTGRVIVDYEAEMISLEGEFWLGNVESRTPPPYTEDGDLILESVKNHYGPADVSAPQIELSLPASSGLYGTWNCGRKNPQ